MLIHRARRIALSMGLLALLLTSVLTPLPIRAQDPVAPPSDPLSETVLTPPANPAPHTTAALIDPPTVQQGPLAVAVLVSPVRSRTPVELTYTFIYTNTTNQLVSGIVLDATFSKFSKSAAAEGNPENIWQYCSDSLCQVPEGVNGPAVTWEKDLLNPANNRQIDGLRFRISDLGPNQSGRFQLKLTTPRTAFPRFDREPRRPAGSARIYRDVALGSEPGTADSTASSAALIEGPVFKIEQRRVSTRDPIFPLEEVEMEITLTHENRDDAITATGTVMFNDIPPGAEFVRAEGFILPTLETVAGKQRLRWDIGTMPPNTALPVKVFFRKLDMAPCRTLNNAQNLITVTANEMPLKRNSQTERETIQSRNAASVRVQPPIEVNAVTASPSSVPFGDTSTITIRVRNFWPQAINNAVLTYNIQENATYLNNTASDAQLLIQPVPNGLSPGGTIRWTLNLPAAQSTTQPSEVFFSLSVKGGYVKNLRGTASVSNLPSDVPTNCIEGRQGQVSLVERLTISKEIDGGDRDGSDWLALTGDTITYKVSLTNSGPEPVTDIQLTDTIPEGNNSSFSFVSGSSTLDEVPISAIENNTPGGTIIWSDITVEPGETRILSYQMVAGGTEFARYCNRIEGTVLSTDESVRYAPRQACVRLNPNIQISKTLVDPQQAIITAPNQEVKFRLTLTNNGTRSYEMGLVDLLPPAFTLLRVEDQVGITALPTINDRGQVEWPLQSVAVGQRIETTLVALFNPPCRTLRYTNELRFQFRQTSGSQSVVLVQSRPSTVAEIQYRCGSNQLRYGSSVSRRTASLRDTIDITINLRNLNQNAALPGVRVTNILPEGFTFEAMLSGFERPTELLRPDGRMQLNWTLPVAIPTNGSVDLKFRARTATTVSVAAENLAFATADDLLVSECANPCRNVSEDGILTPFSNQTIEVRPLITITPRIALSGACANASDTLVYSLTLQNTNIHSYENSEISVSLPIGLRYVTHTGQNAPTLEPDPARPGNTLMIWRNISVPQPAQGQQVAEVALAATLRVGQVWSNQTTNVTGDSPDGLIPVADGEIIPTVPICIDGPGVAKEVSVAEVVRNQEFFYQVEVVNPSPEEFTVTLDDLLPNDIEFLSMVNGPNPTISADRRTLSWENLSVPPISNDLPGVRQLLFRVRYTGGGIGDIITNQISVRSSGVELNQELIQARVTSVEAIRLFYLPMVR